MSNFPSSGSNRVREFHKKKYKNSGQCFDEIAHPEVCDCLGGEGDATMPTKGRCKGKKKEQGKGKGKGKGCSNRSDKGDSFSTVKGRKGVKRVDVYKLGGRDAPVEEMEKRVTSMVDKKCQTDINMLTTQLESLSANDDQESDQTVSAPEKIAFETSSDLLSCPVCMDPFSSVKPCWTSPQCAHMLCRPCIDTMAEAARNVHSFDSHLRALSIKCPSCRTVCPVSSFFRLNFDTFRFLSGDERGYVRHIVEDYKNQSLAMMKSCVDELFVEEDKETPIPTAVSKNQLESEYLLTQFVRNAQISGRLAKYRFLRNRVRDGIEQLDLIISRLAADSGVMGSRQVTQNQPSRAPLTERERRNLGLGEGIDGFVD